MQWICHCVPWQIDIVGVLFGLWPRFCLLFFGVLPFASLFPLAKRKSGWGICGSSCLFGFCGFCVLFSRFACSNGHVMSLYKHLSFSSCSCKDRAFSAMSATLEEKKEFFDDYTALSPSGLELDTIFYTEAFVQATRHKLCLGRIKSTPFSDCFKTLDWWSTQRTWGTERSKLDTRRRGRRNFSNALTKS